MRITYIIYIDNTYRIWFQGDGIIFFYNSEYNILHNYCDSSPSVVLEYLNELGIGIKPIGHVD